MMMQKKTQLMKQILIPLIAVSVIGVLLYVFGMYPIYTQKNINMMKEAFQVISEMDLSGIMDDEEEMDLLDGYRDEGMIIVIADEKMNRQYSTRQSASAEIQRSIQDHKEEYQETPVIHVHTIENVRVIRLRGLVNQEQKYYVSIRREIRSVGEVIGYTGIYLSFLLLLIVVICIVWIKNSLFPFIKKMETSASAANAQLTNAQKEFVANITHELKTPLAVISGQVELLQTMGSKIDQEYYFSSIREEIDKMSSMVGNLLDITIIDHKMEIMEKSDVNLSELMAYLLLKYNALFQQRRVRMTGERAENIHVYGNRRYLEQAVSNYIMNAFQRTPQGKEIRIDLSRNENSVKISVYNEGSLIPEQDIDSIWQSFYSRTENSDSGSSLKNAGLGLYIVKKIVEQHQGGCGAINKENGVEFWINLPFRML